MESKIVIQESCGGFCVFYQCGMLVDQQLVDDAEKNKVYKKFE